jgi:preprotein translocase SecF subunit
MVLRAFKKTDIDFIGFRKKAFYVSVVLIVVGLISLVVRGGPNYGIDFTGGSLIQVHFDEQIMTDEIRSSLAKLGMGKATIQRFGTASDFLITTKGEIGIDTVGPEISSVEISPNPTSGAVRVTIRAAASEENTGMSIVAAVEVSVDTPAAPGSGSVMSAVDFFDSPREVASYVLPIEWAAGEAHVIYVRAQDSKGNWGDVGSATVYITATGVTSMPGEIREAPSSAEMGAAPDLGLGGVGRAVGEVLGEDFPDNPSRIDREEVVGPRVSKGLQLQASLVLLAGLFVIMVYVSFRFTYRFGVGAVVALFHDVLITLGIFSIFNREITIPIIAAFLTIVGYSINDSIVVSDRIRENLRTMRKAKFGELVNSSINQTLSRTMITSLTTMLVLLALLVFGGPVLRDFAMALLIGVLVGTYSSMFVVAPIVVEWERLSPTKRKMMR